MRFLILLLFPLFLTSLYSQNSGDNTVLKIGKITVTEEEFLNRYQLSPHFSDNELNPDSARMSFLYSLAAEKLWALEGEKLMADTSGIFINSMNSLKKMFLKDELYREVIDKNIAITPAEIDSGVRRFTSVVYVKMIACRDEAEAGEIRGLIDAGASFDSLLALRPEAKKQTEPFEVKFGSFDDTALEDSILFAPDRYISGPVKARLGWIIFKVTEKVPNPLAVDKPETVKSRVRNVIYERRSLKLTDIFMSSLLGGREISGNEEQFRKVLKLLTGLLSVKNISDTEGYNLTENDLKSVYYGLSPDELKAPFVYTGENSPSTADFLFYIFYQNARFRDNRPGYIAEVLKMYSRYFIEHEALAAEAVKRGLDLSAPVIHDTEMWKDNYLAQSAAASFSADVKITDDELKEYYEKKSGGVISSTQVNILEILNTDLDVISFVLEQLAAGADFRELAREVTQRTLVKEKGGEWGWFNADMAGDIGKIAAELEPGQIYGPVKTSVGYSVIKLIGKRKGSDSLSHSFDQIKDYLRQQLYVKKVSDLLTEKTVKLAGEQEIFIDIEKIRSLNITPLKVFTIRMIGFGGRMAALPYTTPFYEWVKYLKKPLF
ncbi:MAG: peptidylprolyl isomerase [Ignavibacteriaceae bacterium]|nr:peptidylprolyl isomerase [Ignavibacteriaceae bacterium]